MHGLYPVTPNSNQNLIFPHDSPSLRVIFYNIPCHIFFNFYYGSVGEICRHIKRPEYKLEQRSRHGSALICILFPFLHSPVFSYWPLFFLPSCSLFFSLPLLSLRWKLCGVILRAWRRLPFLELATYRTVLIGMGACLTTNKHKKNLLVSVCYADVLTIL